MMYRFARHHMSDWTVGETIPVRACRRMVNAQLSPLFLSVETQDIIDELMDFKERALSTHIINAMPRFMLNTPGMRRRAKAVDTLLEAGPGRPYARPSAPAARATSPTTG